MLLKALTACGLMYAGSLCAQPLIYHLDPSHSQALFSYDHAGFSTTFGLVSGFEGTITLDRDNLSAAKVDVSINSARLLTGDAERDEVFLQSGIFFKLAEHPTARFASTDVQLTGATTAQVTGDMTINGVTRRIVLDVAFNGETDSYPFPPNAGRPAVGFDARTTLKRSDFDLGEFAPFISDDVDLRISVEAVADSGG